jgi:hypothetical protein
MERRRALGDAAEELQVWSEYREEIHGCLEVVD